MAAVLFFSVTLTAQERAAWMPEEATADHKNVDGGERIVLPVTLTNLPKATADMSKFTKEMVDDYADKLLIGLTEEENKMVLDEFNIIDSDIAKVMEIDNIESVEPMTHTLDDFEYELREDVIEESVDIDDLLKNCDDYINDEVRVPKVVE